MKATVTKIQRFTDDCTVTTTEHGTIEEARAKYDGINVGPFAVTDDTTEEVAVILTDTNGTVIDSKHWYCDEHKDEFWTFHDSDGTWRNDRGDWIEYGTDGRGTYGLHTEIDGTGHVVSLHRCDRQVEAIKRANRFLAKIEAGWRPVNS